VIEWRVDRRLPCEMEEAYKIVDGLGMGTNVRVSFSKRNGLVTSLWVTRNGETVAGLCEVGYDEDNR
jgi:hypothetical protein